MKKTFDKEWQAKKFAEEVGGTITQKYLPDYMSVITVWVVEYENKDFYIYQHHQAGADRYYDYVNKKYKEVIINAPNAKIALDIFIKERGFEEDRDLFTARSVESVQREEQELKEAGYKSWEEWDEDMHPSRPIEL